VTGKSLTGHDVEKAANAWIVNLEDPEDEQHRRILAACKAVNIDPDRIKDRLLFILETMIASSSPGRPVKGSLRNRWSIT